MTLEELKTRYENKQYADKQSECMKKLVAYRSMMEYKDECMEYAARVEELQSKIDFAIEHKITIPTFFEDYHRRIDSICGKEGKRRFCWIYNKDSWGTWENGDIVAYEVHWKELVKVKPTEELYCAFLENIMLIEHELDQHLETYLKGF